jgi:DNA replication protein DnaC
MEFTTAVGGRNWGKELGLPATLTEPDVLLLDDVDKAPWTPITLGWMWQLLDVRRGKQRSTIMTSNQMPHELIRHWEEYIPKNKSVPFAILDRMKPMLVLELAGDSLRRKESTLQQANQQEELAYE